MAVGECILITLLILFVLIYFILIPLTVQDTDVFSYIWCPWKKPGCVNSWTSDMCNCVQNVIDQNKPADMLGTTDPDIINNLSRKYDFFTFMNQYINSNNDAP